MSIFRSYRIKRLLGRLVSNSQSIRWQTQGRILAKAAKEVRVTTNSALDVGCGGGTYAIENHLRFGTRTTLSDYSSSLLELARAQVQNAGFISASTFVQCSAENLPFEKEHFDFIQCLEVLEHLENPKAALLEFRRVATQNARLVISVPHPPEWFFNEGHLTEGFTAHELKKLVEESGWETVRIEYCFLIISRIVYLIINKFNILLPLNPLITLENLVPHNLRPYLLPYDIVLTAKTKPFQQ